MWHWEHKWAYCHSWSCRRKSWAWPRRLVDSRGSPARWGDHDLWIYGWNRHQEGRWMEFCWSWNFHTGKCSSCLHVYLTSLWYFGTTRKWGVEYLSHRRQTSCNSQQQGEDNGTFEFEKHDPSPLLSKLQGNRGKGTGDPKTSKVIPLHSKTKERGGVKNRPPLLLFRPRAASLMSKRRQKKLSMNYAAIKKEND